ncbi:MAG: hypothetical protein R2726_04790 [Acidimicrobiales bacterium]
MDIDSLPDMLRVDEAAAVLRISRSRAYEEVAAFQRTGGVEGLASIRIGRTLRVLEAGAAGVDRGAAWRPERCVTVAGS